MIERKQLVPADKAAKDLIATSRELEKIADRLEKAGLYGHSREVWNVRDACVKAGVKLEHAARDRYVAERRGEVED